MRHLRNTRHSLNALEQSDAAAAPFVCWRWVFHPGIHVLQIHGRCPSEGLANSNLQQYRYRKERNRREGEVHKEVRPLGIGREVDRG